MRSTLETKTGPGPAAAGAAEAHGARVRVASFPPSLETNPYQRLLYGSLAAHGFETVTDARLRFGWLRRVRREVDVLHFHWPQGHYRFRHGPRRLRPLFAVPMLALFAARLAFARALGYRIAWTIHQVFPHETSSLLLDRLGGMALAAFSNVLLAHDAATAALARRKLGRAATRVEIVPHGSYVDVYPRGRSREAVRAELGIRTEAFVFLCFGELRAYKDVDALLAAFASVSLPDAVLVVAGDPRAGQVGRTVESAARADARVKPLLRFVPAERVSELYEAADVAVIARSDGGTSGSLVLALSLGKPTVAARASAYIELMGGEDAGWLFEPGNVDSLREALEEAGRDRAALGPKGAAARQRAERLDWPGVAARTAALLRAREGARA